MKGERILFGVSIVVLALVAAFIILVSVQSVVVAFTNQADHLGSIGFEQLRNLGAWLRCSLWLGRSRSLSSKGAMGVVGPASLPDNTPGHLGCKTPVHWNHSGNAAVGIAAGVRTAGPAGRSAAFLLAEGRPSIA